MKLPKLQIFTLLMIAGIAAACGSLNNKAKLPVMGESEITEDTIDGKLVKDTVFYTIGPFGFMDQDSNMVTDQSLSGHIYVTDFFFTSCPSICPKMKQQLIRVHDQFLEQENFTILSHTIDPKHDSVPVLKEYAGRLGVESDKWHFVTGEKDDIYRIADRYYVAVFEDEDAPGGYNHSGHFLLIDKSGRIRGVYDGTIENEVDELMADIEILMDEYR